MGFGQMKREANRDGETFGGASGEAMAEGGGREMDEREMEEEQEARGGGEGMDERQMNESFHERNSYRIRETPYGVPATRATRRLIGIRPWQPKQGFL